VAERAVVFDLWDMSDDGRAAFAGAFYAWCGPDARPLLRVLFTPDVLVAIDRPHLRGAYYDEGLTTQCWIERGVATFEACLADAFAARPSGGFHRDEPTGWDSAPLVAKALVDGYPIDDVRDLL